MDATGCLSSVFFKCIGTVLLSIREEKQLTELSLLFFLEVSDL